jgi:hypothetical protein
MHEKRENRTKGAISEVGTHIEKSGNQPWFSEVKMTPVINSRKWNSETVRRFRKPFRIPINFIGEHPLLAANINSNFHQIFPFNYCLLFYLFIYLV